jgi:hypothetical protein
MPYARAYLTRWGFSPIPSHAQHDMMGVGQKTPISEQDRVRREAGWRTEKELLTDPACWDSPIRIFGLDTPVEQVTGLDLPAHAYAGPQCPAYGIEGS